MITVHGRRFTRPVAAAAAAGAGALGPASADVQRATTRYLVYGLLSAWVAPAPAPPAPAPPARYLAAVAVGTAALAALYGEELWRCLRARRPSPGRARSDAAAAHRCQCGRTGKGQLP